VAAEKADKIIATVGSGITSGVKKFALQFRPTYAKYLANLLEWYEKSKPFSFRTSQSRLKSFTYPPALKSQ
jgi:hypothetical protein